MNDLQRAELELLKQFIDVCEKLELRYYLVCGSALGAVKYGGFIPWDDDVDVAMPRRDYEVFLRSAQALLPEHIFLQNYRTDPAFPAVFSKLRNSRTTFIEKTTAHLPINHGIFIDIFPLDGYPKGRLEQAVLKLRKRIHLLKISCVYRYESRSFKGKLLYRLGVLMGWDRNTQKQLRKYERMLSKHPLETAAVWCNYGNWQGKRDYAPAWHYAEGKAALFEGLKVRIPACPREYLTQKYGDYTLDPPLQERKAHHHCTVCDCSQSYTKYLKQS